MNSVFFRVIYTKEIFVFHFWLLAFARKKLAFAQKIMALHESGWLQPPSSPGSYAYEVKYDVANAQSHLIISIVIFRNITKLYNSCFLCCFETVWVTSLVLFSL